MSVCGLVVVPLLSVTLSRMPLQLYDLPFDMLEMIGEFYDLAQREEGCTRPTVLNLADSLEFGPSTARLSAGAPFAGPPLYAWTHA